MNDISSMTNEQLNEALAIEVKGWERVSYHGEWWWRETKGGHSWRPYLVSDWQPCTDLNQAVECAEKLGWYPMIYGTRISDGDPTPVYSCYLRKFGQEGIIKESRMTKCYESPARALSEAVLMAVRGEG